jgi:uncharacterized protein YbjQ (UPF0145 family)
MADAKSRKTGELSLACPFCRDRTGPAEAADTDWGCPRCFREWVFRTCGACGEASHVGALLPSRGEWTCVWCASNNGGYRRRKDPKERTAGDLADAVARKGTGFAWPVPQKPVSPGAGAQAGEDAPRALVVTTNEIAGHRITAVHGDVIGVTALATNLVTSWLVGLSGVVGGETRTLSNQLLSARKTARARMWAEARALGANAVIAARYDCNELKDVIVEVVAYGTAVTVASEGMGVRVPLLHEANPTTSDDA